jgi:hypothetical protein
LAKRREYFLIRRRVAFLATGRAGSTNLSLDRPANCSTWIICTARTRSDGSDQITNWYGSELDLVLSLAKRALYRAESLQGPKGRSYEYNVNIEVNAIGFQSREESLRDMKTVINFLSRESSKTATYSARCRSPSNGCVKLEEAAHLNIA